MRQISIEVCHRDVSGETPELCDKCFEKLQKKGTKKEHDPAPSRADSHPATATEQIQQFTEGP